MRKCGATLRGSRARFTISFSDLLRQVLPGVMALLCAGIVSAAEPPDAADILVLGEVHDNPLHHAEQARLVTAIAPQAVVWEMLTNDQSARLPGIDLTDAAKVEAALGWNASGWPDFAMYHPIFVAGADAVHLGAAVPRSSLRKVMEEGALATWGPLTQAFDAALALGTLDPSAQAEREREQAEAHCNALPAELLPGMVEAQRYRDARMALTALEALDRGLKPVVIITGNGHARTDVGVPAMIRAARPEVLVWSLGQLETEPGDEAPYDSVNVTPPIERDDPCKAFQ